MHQNETHFTADALHRPGGPLDTNRIRDMIENLGPDAILRHFVVIPKGDLPEVTAGRYRASVGPFSANTHDDAAANRIWGHALAALALAEHLDAVNEDDVEALRNVLDNMAGVFGDKGHLARELARAGVRVETVDRDE